MKTMTAKLERKYLWVCGLLAACLMMIPSAGAQRTSPRITAEINSAEQSPLKNSVHPLAQPQFDAGRMAADTRLTGISMVFNRSTAQESALRTLIAAQQNPASPFYHQWLTPDQFAAQFGMTDADLSKVQSWLEQQGFSVASIARSKNAIHFSGSVRQIEQAFSTQMHYYKINGTRHFAPSTTLSVPSALAPAILGITNLDDFRPKSHMLSRKNASVKPSFTSSVSGDVFFAPGDIGTVYDIKPLYNSSVTGTGQSITLVGQSEIQNSDIEAFESAAGLPVKDPVPYLVPNSGNATVQAEGDEAESDLDVEWAGAIAPGATINFVYTGSNLNYGAFDSLQYAIDEKIGTIISSSYGECEAELAGNTLGSGAAAESTLESAFEQAATQGQTIMSAAGDDGSTDCFVGIGPGEPSASEQEALAVDYPASSQYVTGMGGTEISSANAAYDEADTAYWAAEGASDVVSSALQYIPEMAWNDDASGCGEANCLSAGGGGASALFPKPTWQKDVPGIPTDGKRDVPDLALYASPSYPGYLFCSSDTSDWQSGQESSCSSGFRDASTEDLTVAGGTSFDGPIFSGILALINQKQGYATGQGLINPTLYTLAANSTTYASAFHDITLGNNDCEAGSADCSSTAGFSAGTGYDQVTGLGSVDATNLATAWPANTTSTAGLIATTTTITASNSAPNVNATDSFTITVAAATGTPTGTITLTVDGGTPISETLASNGTYIYSTSFTTAGSHTILAAYVADSTDAASTGSVTVNVAAVSSGKGTIAFTPAPAPSTLTVAQGSAGNETISVTPASGYTGTVDLTFDTSNDTALQNLCWGFTNMNSAGDGTVAITGTEAVTTVLTLDTNASDCATEAEMRTSGKQPLRRLHPTNTAKNTKTKTNPVPFTVAFAGLLLIGFMGRGSRKLRGLAGLLLLAVVGFAATACGGGVYTTATSNPPTGTYTITLTGTDSATSSITATSTFTFVIN
ncbi:MAG TPA: protease pro-enzyme activation domain-containing protein [Terracidiphilus sp.]